MFDNPVLELCAVEIANAQDALTQIDGAFEQLAERIEDYSVDHLEQMVLLLHGQREEAERTLAFYISVRQRELADLAKEGKAALIAEWKAKRSAKLAARISG